MFWPYVLQNDNGRFCVGHAEDLETRLEDHNVRIHSMESSRGKMVPGDLSGPNRTQRALFPPLLTHCSFANPCPAESLPVLH
jgi:hypothetical protein